MNDYHLAHYKERQIKFETEWKALKRTSFNISLLRFALFLLGAVGMYFCYRQDLAPYYFLLVFVIGLVPFLYLVSRGQNYQTKELLAEQLMKLNAAELKGQQGDISAFNDGKDWKESNHPFALDLDLFGHKSLFQYLNRCTSVRGEKALAKQLMYPLSNVQEIRERQAAIKELSNKEEWRQSFWAQGSLSNQESRLEDFIHWVNKGVSLPIPKILEMILYIGPALFFISTFLAFLSLVPATVCIVIFVLQLLITGRYLSSINAIHSQVSKIDKDLRAQTELIRLIEKEDFHAMELKHLKDKLSSEEVPASTIISKLSAILSSLDSRLNMLVGVFLNGAFLWDLQQIKRINKWKEAHAANVPKWFAALHRWEAYCSFAQFDFLKPNNIFPEISDQEAFELEASELGHPLLLESSCVSNAYSMNGWGKIDIVTGANMAGKSTFLRTVGINMILAMCGSSVMAKNMLLRPTRIFSSMRTEDSLADNSSYFFAELSRLRKSMDLAEDGKGVFIILDEILKGTNSEDKRKGSAAFIKRLTGLKCSGMVATHDLELAVLEQELHGNVRNKCFEVEIINDDLHFDYRLRDTVCETLNATFLLKKMDII